MQSQENGQGSSRKANGQRMPKESKWAKDAQEKTNGMQEPASNITEKAQMTILSHKQQAQRGPVGLDQITSQQEQQGDMAGNNGKATKRIKGQVREREAYNPTKPSPKGSKEAKNMKSKNNPRHKKLRMIGRMCRQVSRSRQAREQQASFERTQK